MTGDSFITNMVAAVWYKPHDIEINHDSFLTDLLAAAAYKPMP